MKAVLAPEWPDISTPSWTFSFRDGEAYLLDVVAWGRDEDEAQITAISDARRIWAILTAGRTAPMPEALSDTSESRSDGHLGSGKARIYPRLCEAADISPGSLATGLPWTAAQAREAMGATVRLAVTHGGENRFDLIHAEPKDRTFNPDRKADPQDITIRCAPFGRMQGMLWTLPLTGPIRTALLASSLGLAMADPMDDAAIIIAKAASATTRAYERTMATTIARREGLVAAGFLERAGLSGDADALKTETGAT